jgi:hypothetical protein
MTSPAPARAGKSILETWNGVAFDAADVPVLPVERFRSIVLDVLREGGRLAALFGRPAEGGRVRLVAVLADDKEGNLGLLSAASEG